MDWVIPGRRLPRASLLLLAFAVAGVAADEPLVRLAEEEARQAVASKVDPEYPALARQLRLTGEVQVEVTIAATGAVEKVTVTRGNTLLTNAVITAVKRWKFNPFQTQGKAVRAVAPMKFNFRM
jgi:protein TonB